MTTGCITAADAERDDDWLDFDTPRSQQPLEITPRAEPSLIQPRRVGDIPPSREWLGGDLLRLSRDEDGQLLLDGGPVTATFESHVVRLHMREGQSYVISSVVYRQLLYTDHVTPAVGRLLAALEAGAALIYERHCNDFFLVQGKQRSRMHPSNIGRALGLRRITCIGRRFILTERTVA